MSAASEISMADAQMADVMVITSDESTSAADHIERGRGVVTSAHASIDSLVDNIEVTMTKARRVGEKLRSHPIGSGSHSWYCRTNRLR